MKERIHEHLIGELRQNTRTDTVFVIVALLLNLVVLAVNSAIGDNNGGTSTILMFIFIILQIFVNGAVTMGLLRGKKMRLVILNGLLEMYRDEGVDKYYDKYLLRAYTVRYRIFISVILSIGVISIIVPLILRYS